MERSTFFASSGAGGIWSRLEQAALKQRRAIRVGSDVSTMHRTSIILNLAVALGIGLLIGVERERRKGEGPSRSFAGIRTFTIASLAGATSMIVGGGVLLATATAGIAVLAAAAYWTGHGHDPGLTTEVALVLTVILGGLSMQQPALAGGLAVTVAVLLTVRSQLHRFVRSVLTDDELQDALIFAGANGCSLERTPGTRLNDCRGKSHLRASTARFTRTVEEAVPAGWGT